MRDRPSARGIGAIAVLLVFTVWITWRAKALEIKLGNSAGETPEIVGKAAPDFQLLSLDGHSVSTADFHSKKMLVVTFWASWCGPCRMELPVLAAFYRKIHKDDSGFDVVAISVDEDPEEAREAAAKLKLPFTVLLDPSSKALHLYGVNGIPTLFVIDKYGKVIHGKIGYEMGFDYQLALELWIKDYRGILDAGSH